jgi:hypothetical protein
MTETALETHETTKSDNLPHSSQTTQDTPITQASGHETSNDAHVVYTPDIDEARGYYDPSCASRFHGLFSNPDRRNADYAKLSREIHAEFDRMIETVRHKAWQEGHETGWMDAMESVQSDTMTSRLLAGMTPNPYENHETKETK